MEWLSELLDALLKTHVRLGDDSQETRTMLDKHRKFVDVAQVRCFTWSLANIKNPADVPKHQHDSAHNVFALFLMFCVFFTLKCWKPSNKFKY